MKERETRRDQDPKSHKEMFRGKEEKERDRHGVRGI